MADRTVRAIFEARVSGAQKGMRDLAQDVDKTGKQADELAKDLKDLDGLKAEPDIDVQIDEAKKRLADITLELDDLKGMEATPEVTARIEDAQKRLKDVRSEIKDLTGQKAEVRVDVAIKDAEKRLRDLTIELGELRQMDASPEVDVKVKDTQKKLRDVKAELRELKAAKSEITVTADTKQAEAEIASVGDAGEPAGDAAGEGIGKGILGALKSIPIAGAVVGIGAAIAGGILAGVMQGLQIEAERDLFSARTGLDEQTSARFGRAAGEAYAQAWGDSVADNMETARVALEQGLIDADAVDAEVEQVIASLTGITDIMQADIPTAARAAGQLIKTGLVDNADEAFDVLVAGYQSGADASQDLLDTLIEYPTHFRDLGLSAAEATGLLIQGMDGGAFNADKVADALKELTIRVKELDEGAADAFKTLALDAEEMSAAFAEGGPRARDALEQILTALSGVEDPAERARLAVQLFGTQAEDMAGALGNLNLTTAASELGDFAGAADRALGVMADNTATKMEEARRNVEVAMDGIKGALAESFGDEIGAVAEWISQNRGPMMEFFAGVIDGTFEMAKGFVEFAATTLDSIANVVESFAGMQDIIEIVMPAARFMFDDMGESVDGLREKANEMRTGWVGAIEDTQAAAADWIGPEIMAAHMHDAKTAMASDMDDLSAHIDASGGTVTVNGDAMNAEQVLEAMVRTIDASDGTVSINGDRVPADQAVAALIAATNASEGTVTIGANPGPANRAIGGVKTLAAETTGTVRVEANTQPARNAISRLHGTVWVDVVARGGLKAVRHDGGWIEPGLNAGGWVPGRDPGYDNVLWPLNSGGRVLNQPLTGGEYVVNSKAAAANARTLEAINAGLSLAAPSLIGLGIEGHLDTPMGPAFIRAVVKNELDGAAQSLAFVGGR